MTLYSINTLRSVGAMLIAALLPSSASSFATDGTAGAAAGLDAEGASLIYTVALVEGVVPAKLARTVKAAPGGTLTLDVNTGGDITIIGWDRQEISMSADLGGDEGSVQVDLVPDVHGARFLAEPLARKRSTSYRFVLRVPRDYSVVTSSIGGEIRTNGFAGNLRGSTAGGSIAIDEAPEGVDLSTGGGDIRIGPARKLVEAHTGGGNITLDGVDGAVRASTGAGAVVVHLTGTTPSSPDTVTINSGSGPVSVIVDKKVGAQFDIETAYTRSNGPVRIHSDTPLKTSESSAFEDDGGTPRRYVRATGQVGDGHYKVRIRTVNGDVRILHGA